MKTKYIFDGWKLLGKNEQKYQLNMTAIEFENNSECIDFARALSSLVFKSGGSWEDIGDVSKVVPKEGIEQAETIYDYSLYEHLFD